MSLKNDSVFMGRPVFLLQVWIELIHPALTSLFSSTSGKVGGDGTPVSWTVFVYQFDEQSVFFDSPRTTDRFASLLKVVCGRWSDVIWIG